MALVVIASLGRGNWVPRTGLGFAMEHFLAFFVITRALRNTWRVPSGSSRSNSSASCRLALDERLGGNTETLVQSPDHFECERSPAIEYFVHAIAAANKGN